MLKETNTPTRPRIEPGSPDPESDALTIRPVRPPPPFSFELSHDHFCRLLDGCHHSARQSQGIRSLPAKHIWKNRQNHRLALVPHDQYQRALTVKMKDRKPVIKMVTPVEQATEMVMAELKREWDALKPKKKKNGSLLHDRNHIQSRTGSPFETHDDTNPSTVMTLLSSSHPP